MHQPDGEQMAIYDAAMKYQAERVPLVVFAGQEYGTGSSRDWAAKGTRLLGVKAVIAQSFERIHRSNLVGMGVLPLPVPRGRDRPVAAPRRQRDLRPDGSREGPRPRQERPFSRSAARTAESRKSRSCVRIDTPIEVDYYRHGGILPYVLRQLVA